MKITKRMVRIYNRLQRAEDGLEDLHKVADWYAEDIAYLLKMIEKETPRGK